MVISAQTWAGAWPAVNSTGALATPSVGPAGVLYVNGVANAATVTITGSNPYTWSVTLPTLANGQTVQMYITATIAGVATVQMVAEESAESTATTATPGTQSPYVTLAEMRAELGITVVSDTTDDGKLERAAEAASRMIDNYCARRFYLDSSATARYYTAEEEDELDVDDIGSLTSLAVATDESDARTYGYTWTIDTHFEVEPFNALATGKPITKLHIMPSSTYSFPLNRKACRITALWGWPAVPGDVKTACMIQAVRLYKRRDAVFGVMGSAETGQMVLPALDPDVKALLWPYVKLSVGGV